MRDFGQAYAELITLGHRIENFLRISNYYNFSDLSSFDIDYLDMQQFLKEELQTIMDRLERYRSGSCTSASLSKEISRRYKNVSGKYGMEKGDYFCSGSLIEVLVTDCDTGETCWALKSMEHNGILFLRRISKRGSGKSDNVHMERVKSMVVKIYAIYNRRTDAKTVTSVNLDIGFTREGKKSIRQGVGRS